jgi:DeoR/GlpR family transcriptional regulator of sugar metabolism
MVGPLTRYCIQQIHFHKAFIGVDGWQAETGFTGRNMLRCDVVDAVLAKNVPTWALTDASKFGQIHPYPLSSGYRVAQVITDSGLNAEALAQLEEQGVAVTRVASR